MHLRRCKVDVKPPAVMVVGKVVEFRKILKDQQFNTLSAEVVAGLFCFGDILVFYCQILLARLYLI